MRNFFTAALAMSVICMSAVWAEQGTPAPDADAELAKKLQNPIAALISVPVKLDWDTGIGPADADRFTYVVQPVIPFSLNQEWNLISRTIVPVYIDAQSPVAGGSDTSGMGDVLQSFFFSPKAPTAGGWIWGVGPVLSLPTASKDALGSEKYGAGPTVVVLRQDSGWTYGMLANHMWSFAGNDSRADVSATFIQPFISYTTKTYTTFGLNTESTYDWEASQWTVPINASVSQLMKFGKQRVSFAFGYRNYVDAPTGGPDWGLRFTVTFLFPK
jgi:hypothetical protein